MASIEGTALYLVDHQVVVVDPVQQEVVGDLPRAIRAERQALAGNQRSFSIDLHSRREVGEVDEVPLVERQARDLHLAHDLPERRGVGLHQWARGDDVHRLGQRGYRQHDVHPDGLIDL